MCKTIAFQNDEQGRPNVTGDKKSPELLRKQKTIFHFGNDKIKLYFYMK